MGDVDPLYEELASVRRLVAAWEHVRLAGGVAGVDGQGVRSFAVDADANIRKLAAALAQREYTPLPALSVTLPREGGSTRELTIPPVEDRVVQRAFHDCVGREWDARFLPCSRGYRRGGSTLAAVTMVRNSARSRPWIADADIRDFFGTVSHDRLLQELRDWTSEEDLLRLVRLWLQAPVLRGGRVVRNENGLPLGYPISPLLANVFLHRLDLGLWRPDQTYVRYADDFVVCCRTEETAIDALRAAGEILEEIGLSLATEKSSVIDARTTSFVFLGHVVRRPGGRAAVERETPSKRTLYVTESGSRIVRRRGRFLVERAGSPVLDVAIRRVREINLFGSIGLTPGTVHACLDGGIPIVYLTTHGRYLGRLEGTLARNPFVRQAQLDVARESDLALTVSRSLVAGKIANQSRIVQRHGARRASSRPGASKPSACFRALRRAALGSASLEALRSIEGQSSRLFFDELPRLLIDDLGFRGRNRRPPRDPVNSLLSFAYTLLTQEMVSAVSTVGLDPYIGVLHLPRHGRPSLALDLIEEFRPAIADALVIGLVNRRMVRKDDFVVDARGACLLKDDPRRTFLREYENRMLTLFTYEPTGERISYRRALTAQARQLARVLQEPQAGYIPIVLR